jgi:two-component system, sensor histidine kinase ChiS
VQLPLREFLAKDTMSAKAFTVSLLLSLLLSLPAIAHNGAVAIAVPVDGIVIDGDLSDWPTTAHWNSVTALGIGLPPRDAEDFTGKFALGYSAVENAFYIGVEVKDESTVVDTSVTDGSLPAWDSQDGCEVYFDVMHADERSTGGQYALHGNQFNVFIPGGANLPLLKDAEYGVARSNGYQIYEWRLDVGEINDGKAHLGSGMTVAFDIVLCDKDEDGSFSWMPWGRGTVKHVFPDRRGDAILVGADEKLGELRGRVEREDGQGGFPKKPVRLQALASDALWTMVTTNRQGAFTAELPVGAFRVDVERGRGDKESRQVEIEEKHPSEMRLVIPPPTGLVVEAGKGRKVLAGTGIRYGSWHSFGVVDGLLASRVYDLLQDRDGNLWLGIEGGGVSRYDGKYFTNFTSEDGLANNKVYAIEEDREGNLWISTWEDGICRYDGERFTNFTVEDGLANNTVWAIEEDRNGNMWFGTMGSGVSRYDGKYFTNFTSEDGLGNNQVHSIYEDSRGDLWFSTWEGGISRYDGETFTTFTVDDGLGHNWVDPILEDREGNLWFGTHGGVSRYDGAIFSTYAVADGLAHNWVYSAIEDREGNLWFGTWDGGVSRLGRGGFTTFTMADGLANNRVLSSLEGREGNLWFGTEGGVSRYVGKQFQTFPATDFIEGNPANIDITSFLVDRAENLWLGTGGQGVFRYDGEEFTPLTEEDGLGNNIVTSILEDREGNLWFGTYGGVSRFDGEGFTTFTMEDGLGGNIVNALLESRSGDLWFGTEGGLSHFDGGGLTTFTMEDGLVNHKVWTIEEDREGRLWVGTRGGLSCYEADGFTNFTMENGLTHNFVVSILEDRGGNLWIATWDGGLVQYDGEEFTAFEGGGLLGENNVAAMLEDRSGHLWFGTSAGVCRYDGVTFQNLFRRDGLFHDSTSGIIQASNGDIWFNHGLGITRYRPSHTPPSIILTDVIGRHRYGTVEKINLPSSQGFLAFEFSGTSFKTRPEAMAYRYRLKGYEDWQISHEERVEYRDLPIGEYVFEVQAIDRDLAYSEQPATVQVTVSPPYAQIAVLALMGLAVVIAVVATTKMTKSHQDRDRALNDRNQGLEQANARLREADQLKSDFVSNVSHELRTPLTVIKGSVDNMLDGITGTFNEKQERYLHRLQGNSDRLSRLINDLLDLSRIEAGHLQLHPGKVWIEEVCRNVVESLTPLAEEGGIDLQLKDGRLPVSAWGDADRVHQILLNLVNNAIKFTPSGGQVEVGVVQEGEFVRTSVADTGEGISPDQLESVFEKFYQVGDSSANGRGAGIGLSIARRLVELHGGRIWVESGEGQGSTFLFTLPVEG